MTAVVGFDGAVVTNHAAPVTLLLRNPGTRAVEVVLSVVRTDAGLDTLVARRVEVSPGVGRLVTLLIPGDVLFTGWIQVRAQNPCRFTGRVNGSDVQGASNARNWRMELPRDLATPARVVVLGGRGRQVAQAIPGRLGNDVLTVGDALTVIGSLDDRFAPDSAMAWSGVRAILWTEPDFERMPNPAQLEALLSWVETGGRLVIVSAHRSDLLDAPELKRVLPTRGIEVMAEKYAQPFRGGGPDWNKTAPWLVPVGLVPGARGRRLEPSKHFDRVDWPVGLGRITLACFDPLVYDIGRSQTLLSALRRASGVALEYDRDNQNVYYNNWGDPVGDSPYGGTRFYEALKAGNVLTPSVGLYILFGILFVLLIGPIDYKFLKKKGKLRWSPVTLLVYTAIFTGASIGATLVLFAPDEEINRVAILDYAEGLEGRECVSGYVYYGIYTPTGGSFDTGLGDLEQFGFVLAPELDRWSRSTRLPIAPQRWSGAGRQPVELDLGFNTFRAVATRVSGTSDLIFLVEVERVADAKVRVKVTNGLGSPLEDATFVWRNGIVEFGDVPAGEERAFDVALATTRFGQLYRPTAVDWRLGLVASSVNAWLPVRRQAQIPEPWDLSPVLEDDHAVVTAVARSLPIAESLEGEPGFSRVLVRRVVQLPKE